MRFALSLFLLACGLSAAATVTNNIEYARRPSGPLLLDASMPDGPGPFKTVIIVHGGGFSKGSKVTYVPPLFAPLTKAGFAWFTIDYRLAPTARVKDQVEDVESALAWVRLHAAQYKVDTARIALAGESAGAYLVDAVALRPASGNAQNVAAVVSFYGPSDLVRQFRDKPIPEDLRVFFGVRDSSAQEARLRELSPIGMTRRNLPPFLLLHGDADEQVPYEQSPRFCEALERDGNKCELYTVAGGRHGIGQWEQHPDQQGYKRRMVDWLNQTLR